MITKNATAAIHKIAKKMKMALEDGIELEFDKANEADVIAAVARARERSRQMTVLDALKDATPTALLTAALSGAGTAAINKGISPATFLAAGVGGLSTLALNAALNTGKRQESFSDALDAELAELT